MKLKDLLKDVPMLACTADLQTEISGVCYDSRKVSAGDAFVAVTGFAADGNRFIPMALDRGAAAVVTARKPQQEIPYVLVESDRLALAKMSCNFYDHPADTMTMIGITGTNGKTSSTLLLKQVLEQVAGAKVGLVGTMSNLIGSQEIPTERTTPESLELQGLFAQMRAAGCTHVVMEVSSHALSLERVGGVHFDVAAFTNLTEDHLDFHKTMDEYCAAKAELFRRCDRAVVNRDDGYAQQILQAAACPVLTTSVAGDGDLQAVDVSLHAQGVRFTAKLGQQQAQVELPIPGRFTVHNALTVLGITSQLGLPLEDCAQALGRCQGVKGRVEVVPTPGKDYTVLIDYAHSPDGMVNVLSTVKGFAGGRTIALFGCGGDRDKTKRPKMGRVAAELADFAVVTTDNPRTEKPADIIADILPGFAGSDTPYVVVEDRIEAIHWAMDHAQKGDVIVLCGKGHETYQEINHVKHHMDEREIVADYLKNGN